MKGFLQEGTYKLNTLYSDYAALIATALVADIVKLFTLYNLWHCWYKHLKPEKIKTLHKIVTKVSLLKVWGSIPICHR